MDWKITKDHILFYCAVVVLNIFCFGNNVYGAFVFDDNEAIIGNSDVTTSRKLSSIWNNDFWGTKLTSSSSHKSYRPLTTLTFRFNYWISSNSFGFHIFNIGLHTLACCLLINVLQLLINVGQGRPHHLHKFSFVSKMATLMFAVHPIHTENVSGIVGRADILCFIFSLLTVYCYIQISQGNSLSIQAMFGVFAVISCYLAFLSKEQGITTLAVCSAYDILIFSKIPPRRIFHRVKELGSPLFYRHLFLLVSGLLMISQRWQILGGKAPTFQLVDNPHSFVDNFFLRVINYNYIYSLNIWLLLCPWWLCFDWSMGCVPVIETLWDFRLLCPILLWAVMLIIAFYCILSKYSATTRLFSMSCALLILPFLPAANIFFRVGFVVAERNLYFPSVGFCLLTSVCFDKVILHHSSTKFVKYCCVFYMLLYALRTNHRSNDWQSEDQLFKSGVPVCPLNAKVHYNIGKVTADAGKPQEAIEIYRHAIRLNPQYDQAMNNLANILRDFNENLEAETLLEAAVEIRENFAAAWMNLGIVKVALGKVKEGERCYLTAINHRQKFPDCYYNLGNLYLQLKDNTKALSAWRNATLLKPTHVNAWVNILILLDSLDRVSELKIVGSAALSALPNESLIPYNIANALGKAGEYAESEKYFHQALALNESVASFHANLGVLYHRWKKLDKAEKHYRRALQIDPSHPNTHSNLNMII